MYHVKNWAEFQHYKDRNPTWIKVYNRLLDDADFLALPEAAQAQLVKLWLLASRCENKIREDATYLKHALHTNRPYVALLLKHGFLYQSAPVLHQNATDTNGRPAQSVTPRALAREEVPRTTYKDLRTSAQDPTEPERSRHALTAVQDLLQPDSDA